MSADTAAQLISEAIPFFAGLYFTLLGFRVVGKKPGESLKYDEWYAKRGSLLKFGGPVLMLIAVFFAVRSRTQSP